MKLALTVQSAVTGAVVYWLPAKVPPQPVTVPMRWPAAGVTVKPTVAPCGTVCGVPGVRRWCASIRQQRQVEAIADRLVGCEGVEDDLTVWVDLGWDGLDGAVDGDGCGAQRAELADEVADR